MKKGKRGKRDWLVNPCGIVSQEILRIHVDGGYYLMHSLAVG